MNKDVELQYKLETGNKPRLELIEMDKLKPEFKGGMQPGVLMKDIPKYFIEKHNWETYSLILPDSAYIDWLEEKVSEFINTLGICK